MKYFAALGVALLVIAAASVGPWAPSPFTSQTGTNTTAAAWRTALGAAASSALSGYVTNHTGAATNLALTGGSVTTQTNTDLTASRVVVSSASKVLASSSVTSTTLGYLDATSSVQTQLDSKPTVALTNLALLNGTNVFTGTNTFTAAGFYPANKITFRTLYSAPTNLFFGTINTNATTATITNAGDFVNCTSLLRVTLPPLLGSNSMVFVSYGAETTNANSANCILTAYAGGGTNFIGDVTAAIRSTTAGSTYSSQNGPGVWLFANQASFTNQIGNRAAFTTKAPAEHLLGRTAIADTSTDWTLYLGLTTTSSHTNLHIVTLSVIELVKN